MSDAELSKQVEILTREVAALTNLTRFLVSNIVVQQKEVCEINQISPNTIIKMVESGEVEKLQADGSRLNFYTALTANEDLKPRRRRRN